MTPRRASRSVAARARSGWARAWPGAGRALAASAIQSTSNAIDISNRIAQRSAHALEAMGYQVLRDARTYGFASVHGIRLTPNGLDGGADPNHDGIWMAL